MQVRYKQNKTMGHNREFAHSWNTSAWVTIIRPSFYSNVMSVDALAKQATRAVAAMVWN